MKKTLLEQYSRPRTNGIIAINLREDDELIRVCLTDGQSEILVASRHGKVVRFNESTVRSMGRDTSGVKAITLDEQGDSAIGMICVSKESDETVLVVSEKGYGKRSALDDENGEPIYRITNRGGKGVRTMNLTEKTGELIAIDAVTDEDDLMLIKTNGVALRTPLKEVRVMGRATQGVKLIELTRRNEQIAFCCIVPKQDEEAAEAEEAEEGENEINE